MAKRIGMRNFKTAIAVFICILVLESIGIHKPFFACIAAIQTMQTDMHSSFEAGIYRSIGTISGTIIGSISAIVFYKYLPMDILIVRAIVIPLGIMFIIYVLTSLKLKDSVLMSCVVFLSIMISMDAESSLLHYAVERSFSTTFGSVVALLVNRFIYPFDMNSCNKDK